MAETPTRERREDTNSADSRLGSCLNHPTDSVTAYEVVDYTPSSLPARHFDADTTEPISCGIRNLEELLSWNRSKANSLNVATVPLAPREPPLSVAPRRTLVSHDMMGGYLHDRFIQGTKSVDPYVFYHWNYIDIFNYFTHIFVTIPPAVWTNAAHRNAVAVLGTFITEWTDGAKMCEAFLTDEESYRAVADKLVQISLFHGFDGWLINIENTLSEAAAKRMPLFLRYLTDQLHERIPGSLVLWYDSVLDNGQLKWQNELNDSNRQFFDACDGFFTNYNWSERHLQAMGARSGVGDRRADIYVGVDVFARGDVVGGKFDTNKALEVIRKYDFSVAIFAPGWVYETHEDKTEFQKNQDRFWALLSDNIYIHRLTSPLPFISSFCQGFGRALFSRGQSESELGWFHLSAQEVQPLYYSTQLEGQGWVRSRGCAEEAWNGGTSLLLEGLFPARLNRICACVFSLHVPLAPHTLMSLIYKLSPGIRISLKLHTTGTNIQGANVDSVPAVLPDNHQLVRHLSQLCGPWRTDGWNIRCSQLELHDSVLREVYVCIQREGEAQDTNFSCRLGELLVLDAARLRLPTERVQSIYLSDVVWLRGSGDSPASAPPALLLNATLRWDYPPEHVRHFRVYWKQLPGPHAQAAPAELPGPHAQAAPAELPGPHAQAAPAELTLVGRAYANTFRVTELVVSEAPCTLELVVEPVSREGFLIPQSNWGRTILSYTEAALM